MNSAKFLQAFGLVALMVCVALITQSLTIDSIQKEAKEEQITGNEPFIGEIIMFGGNFAPRGWLFCEGQLLSIPSNQSLFSIVGTMYGGDGRTTFGLPDLRGRTPIHPGHGPGLSRYQLGQKGGQEYVTLNTTQLPSHNHGLEAHVTDEIGLKEMHFVQDDSAEPVLIPVRGGEQPLPIVSKMQYTGGGQSINNRQPYQAVHYIIAVQGIYPSRE